MTSRTIRLTIAALGGEGGGVLTDWLITIAEANDYIVQSTSVPGVAQRTGATLYYLEFFPRAQAEHRSPGPASPCRSPRPGRGERAQRSSGSSRRGICRSPPRPTGHKGTPNQALQQTAGHDSFLGLRSSPVPRRC